jgi:ATP-dependent DNA helicase RecG
MEYQFVDWKEKWNDDFLPWICGFANAQGGRLEIGRNDEEKVVGLANPQKLLDDLPNKIKSTMGIVPEINLCYEENLPFIVIAVTTYPNAISYRGKYYFRSGSTNQELTGIALDEFLLRKYGRTWDSAPIIHVAADDLDIVAFREFRKKSLARGRLTKEDLDISDAQLLETLKLTDGNYLKRAAILTFHEDPEKWVTGAYVKIGYFKTDDDLVFQDEIHGSLILMPDKVVDILFNKYFKGLISYKGIQRVETYPVHPDAMREAVLNAIVHKDYATGIPIQIRVYDDKVSIFNAGLLPSNWSVQDLLTFHTSAPHNPDIANAFFRSGMTEAWGRGIEKIINTNISAGKPKPQFEIIGNGLRVTFYTDAETSKAQNKAQQLRFDCALNENEIAVVEFLSDHPTATQIEISKAIGKSRRTVQDAFASLKNKGIIDNNGSKQKPNWIIKQPE